MMANRKFSLFLWILLLNCSLNADWNEEQWEKESLEIDAAYKNYSVHVRDIINSCSNQMKVDLGFQCTGDGGAMHKEVEEIRIKFNAYRRATLEEARALLLFAMDNLLETINSHEKIQPFLVERPFTSKHVGISIGFEGVNGSYSDGSVAFVFKSHEAEGQEEKTTITYCASDPILAPYVDILTEPYEEAIAKARESALTFPYTHQTTAFEAAIDETLLEFSSKVWIQRGLECRSIGGKMNNGVEEIGAVIYLVHVVSQEQAREVAVYITETLLELLNQNEKIRPYLNPYPFHPAQLKFELEFTNYKYTNNREGISQVIMDNNELSYFKEMRVFCGNDVVQAWALSTDLVHKEPYSEGLEIVRQTPFSLIKEIHNMFECGFRWVFVPKRPKT